MSTASTEQPLNPPDGPDAAAAPARLRAGLLTATYTAGQLRTICLGTRELVHLG